MMAYGDLVIENQDTIVVGDKKFKAGIVIVDLLLSRNYFKTQNWKWIDMLDFCMCVEFIGNHCRVGGNKSRACMEVCDDDNNMFFTISKDKVDGYIVDKKRNFKVKEMGGIVYTEDGYKFDEKAKLVLLIRAFGFDGINFGKAWSKLKKYKKEGVFAVVGGEWRVLNKYGIVWDMVYDLDYRKAYYLVEFEEEKFDKYLVEMV